MRSFNDWYFDLFESGNGACLNQQEIAEEAWDYRQTEVDELRAKFDQHDQWLGQRNRDVQELYDINVKHAAEKAELQKRVDAQTRHIEMALIAVKDIHKSAIDEFHDWDVLNEKAPKLCEHLQNLSVAVGELEQALKGGDQ